MDERWQEAASRAERKLGRIIAREGDAGGKRREARYLRELIAEEIRAAELGRMSFRANEDKKEAPRA